MNGTRDDPIFPPLQLPAAPPYALAVPTFRFRALASLAGRAPLGGAREVVLATYLVARLTDDARDPTVLPPVTRAARAAAARTWLANTALPATIRAALTRLAEATVGESTGVVRPLADVITATEPYLDDPARLELGRLARGFAP